MRWENGICTTTMMYKGDEADDIASEKILVVNKRRKCIGLFVSHFINNEQCIVSL